MLSAKKSLFLFWVLGSVSIAISVPVPIWYCQSCLRPRRFLSFMMMIIIMFHLKELFCSTRYEQCNSTGTLKKGLTSRHDLFLISFCLQSLSTSLQTSFLLHCHRNETPNSRRKCEIQFQLGNINIDMLMFCWFSNTTSCCHSTNSSNQGRRI